MTNKQIIKECSYKGECQMMGCFNDDNCFIKQLFEERNRAESEYYRKEQECEELKEELQKYKDNEQEEKEIQKLYNKFNGNSLIEKCNPRKNQRMRGK